jgi:hypothetical protein
MKHTLPLAAALLVGSASLAAVQAVPLYTDDLSSSSVVQIAAKTAKKKAAKTAQVKPKRKAGAAGRY